AGPRRRLIGLVLTGRGIARHGYPVYRAEEAEPCGVVTSGAPSPTLGQSIAMAYGPPEAAEPGTMLEIGIRDTRVHAEVVPLPFYKRPT
nr:glycine cleavage system aminomethyltransferase GcvT [Chloroflexota bacterium]